MQAGSDGETGMDQTTADEIRRYLEQEGQNLGQFEQLLRDKSSEFGSKDHDHDGEPRGIIGQIMESLKASYAAGDFTIGDAIAYAKE